MNSLGVVASRRRAFFKVPVSLQDQARDGLLELPWNLTLQ